MRHPRSRHAFVVAFLAAAAGFGACTLNPQPLPPSDDDRQNAAGANDASTRADAGSFGTDPEAPPDNTADAGPALDSEAGADADAGDAGISDAALDGD